MNIPFCNGFILIAQFGYDSFSNKFQWFELEHSDSCDNVSHINIHA